MITITVVIIILRYWFIYLSSTAIGNKESFYWKTTNMSLCLFGNGIAAVLNTMVIIEKMGHEMMLQVIGLCGLFSTVWHLVMGPVIGKWSNSGYTSIAQTLLFFISDNMFYSTQWWIIMHEKADECLFNWVQVLHASQTLIYNTISKTCCPWYLFLGRQLSLLNTITLNTQVWLSQNGAVGFLVPLLSTCNCSSNMF